MTPKNEIKIQEVSIADVDVFKEYKHCPVCTEPTDLIQETSGPLSEWTQCSKCQNWFAPEVNFGQAEDDEDDVDDVEEGYF